MVIPFPETKDHGGCTPSYLAALEAHFAYVDRETARLRHIYEKSEEFPLWTDGQNIITVVLVKKPDAEEKKVAVNNLIGFATHSGKSIKRVWQGMKSGEWQLIAETD